ncbi:TetR/AcrR family transcriptional regulator [Modestobacter excelsi]|uniref:TetR/AcrR family transcriptional regulator n=1 Tax=Modestobacter excelsi TaxID=2213161 RepID=UPI00110CE39A|nr:TetR/AcrR family transcriptional regulator [Modestobacter excelsi]
MGRREQIADAGVRLIGRTGIHSLTHLSVDAEAELPRGSTSYYARTRRDLLALVVDRLSEGSQADVDDLAVPAVLTRAEAAQVAVDVLDRMARRQDAQAARFALMFELRDDAELRAALTTQAAVRPVLTAAAAELLRAIGVTDPAAHAPDLVGLVDALLMYRTAQAAPVDAARVLRAYLDGLA